jgi:hypothetical protein
MKGNRRAELRFSLKVKIPDVREEILNLFKFLPAQTNEQT